MVDDDHVERATTLQSEDAPSGTRLDNSESLSNHYNRLAVLNSLDWNGKWKRRRRETTKNASAIVDAVAGQLELTPYQKEEAHRKFSSLPSRFNEGYSTRLLALCVCGLTARKDGRNYHPNYIHPDTDINNDFTEITDDLGVSYSALYKCWEAVKYEVGN